MTRPTASIIVPVYNRPLDIQRLLQRLSRQARQDFEVVIVDDCSDTPVQDVVEGDDYPWELSIIRHETNCGAGAARNTGIRNARGEIIVFIDSDADVPDADWFEKFMYLYSEAGKMAECAGCSRYVFHSDVFGIHATIAGRVDTYSNWYGSCMVSSCRITDRHVPMNNTAVARDIFEEIGMFSSNLHLGEDIEWCFRCLDQGVGLFFVPGAPIGHFDRNTPSDVWRHYYRIGEYSPVIRRLTRQSPYRLLFPEGGLSAFLLFFPMTVLMTLYIVKCWIRRDPFVVFFAPGLYMANVAYYLGMCKTITDNKMNLHADS